MNHSNAITWDELEALPGVHDGLEAFRINLNRTRSRETLMRIIAQFAEFNAPAAAGVLRLTSEVSDRPDIFRDRKHPVRRLADRSYTIGRQIYLAATDEYGKGKFGRPHRTLSQETQEEIGRFFGWEGEELDRLLEPNASTVIGKERLRTGYGLGRILSEPELYETMGHHLFSERLADPEFALLWKHICERWPKLAEHLKKTGKDIWIRVHGTTGKQRGVEADHADAALLGANMMMQYGNGTVQPATAMELFVKGSQNFARLQKNFYEGIGKA